jgi:hypothetical protein
VYPEQWETSLEEALSTVAFPPKLPAHPAVSLDEILTTFLSPDGLTFVMIFPLPAPQQPLRMPNLEIFQSPWVGGDPEASLEEVIANDPSVNKALYTVQGVTALGNKAHSPEDQTGENPAFLRLVLDDVEVQLFGGESLDLLIEIAESMK